VSKDHIKELEDKVFPLMKEVVNKIANFDNKIEDSKRQMVRFDQIIIDKASKLDLKAINNRVDKTVGIADFDQ